MKQHITQKQLNELSDKGKGKLLNYCDKNNICRFGVVVDGKAHPLVDRLPLLSIGQMIEFLGDDYIYSLYLHEGRAVLTMVKTESVCDALWQACKEVLE